MYCVLKFILQVTMVTSQATEDVLHLAVLCRPTLTTRGAILLKFGYTIKTNQVFQTTGRTRTTLVFTGNCVTPCQPRNEPFLYQNGLEVDVSCGSDSTSSGSWAVSCDRNNSFLGLLYPSFGKLLTHKIIRSRCQRNLYCLTYGIIYGIRTCNTIRHNTIGMIWINFSTNICDPGGNTRANLTLVYNQSYGTKFTLP